MRYEIFKQDMPNQPHGNVGSVHAPDAEMALMHARDVYGRRPNAISMWAVPESAIYSESQESRIKNQESRIKNQEPRIKNQESRIKNQESRIKNQESRAKNQEPRTENQELEAQSSKLMAQDSALSTQHLALSTTYAVFRKTSHRRSMTYVVYAGMVEASTPEDAVTVAMRKFPSPETFVWWICPEAAISKTEADAAPSWFEPAKDKVYRQQSYYGDVARQSRRQRAEIAGQLSDEETHD